MDLLLLFSRNVQLYEHKKCPVFDIMYGLFVTFCQDCSFRQKPPSVRSHDLQRLIRGQRNNLFLNHCSACAGPEGGSLAKSQVAIGFLRHSGADTDQDPFAPLWSSTVDQYVQYFDPIKPNYGPKCFSVVRNPKESIDC